MTDNRQQTTEARYGEMGSHKRNRLHYSDFA